MMISSGFLVCASAESKQRRMEAAALWQGIMTVTMLSLLYTFSGVSQCPLSQPPPHRQRRSFLMITAAASKASSTSRRIPLTHEYALGFGHWGRLTDRDLFKSAPWRGIYHTY